MNFTHKQDYLRQKQSLTLLKGTKKAFPYLMILFVLVCSVAFDAQAAPAEGDPFAEQVTTILGWMKGSWTKMIVLAVGVGGMVVSGLKGQLGGLATSLGVFVFGMTFFNIVEGQFQISMDDIPALVEVEKTPRGRSIPLSTPGQPLQLAQQTAAR